MSTPPNQSGIDQKNLLNIVIKDKAALYASWMPFIKGGALFVPTSHNYHLGDEVLVLVQFMEETEKLQLIGKVVWITPRGAQGGRASGIGVQIIEDKTGTVVKKFETVLAGSEKAERATHSL